MAENWEGIGNCAYCKSENSFRELTFFENVKKLGIFAVGMLGKNRKDIVRDATGVAGNNRFPNFICTNCNGDVHQCGGCKVMLPYQEVGKCSKCGYT